MSEPVKFILIGAGAIAQSYVQAIRALDEARLVGVADPRSEVAAAAAESEQCAAADTVEGLLEKVSCDAAIICTPPATHTDISRALLERKIPVLCEKPLCIRSADAERLLDLSERSGALFSMATKFRFVPDVIEARRMVTSGVIGEVLLFENAFTSRVDMTTRWNSDPKIAGGGVLIDNGTHSVDLIRYFLGPVTQVQAFEGRRVQSIPVEDSAQLRARTADGVLCTVDLSWSLNKELDNYVHIYGSGGTIRVGWKKSAYKTAAAREWTEFGSGYDKVVAFQNQIRNFGRAVRGIEAPMVSAKDALASVRVIEAAYQSMHQDSWVPVLAEEPR